MANANPQTPPPASEHPYKESNVLLEPFLIRRWRQIAKTPWPVGHGFLAHTRGNLYELLDDECKADIFMHVAVETFATLEAEHRGSDDLIRDLLVELDRMILTEKETN